MPIRQYKPTTAGRRGASVIDYKAELAGDAQRVRGLRESYASTGGRNHHGRVTNRAMAGHGQKRYYRKVDFMRDKDGVPASVAAIEYDPFRSAFIARLHYADGEKRYIIAPKGLKVGGKVLSGAAGVEPDVGNAMPLSTMPLGMVIHNIELQPGKGAQLARAAGVEARLVAREGGHAHVVLPSGEMRKVPEACRATIGQVGNVDHELVVWGKAGRHFLATRKRPTGRGMAKNPVDHPMGGGAARRKGHIPQSPSGVLAKGGKTRKSKARTNRQIIRRRKGAPVEVVS
ncbi:MAG: 50S ribosomal protein L2 [Planctomycetota bacterium]|nr:50S ribosomal protein L2 [Planctomycetota bacterium]